MQKKEYFIEFYHVGNSVKVTAVDPETGCEVSIVGAPEASRKHLSDIAVRKLKYMMKKKHSPAGE